MRFIKFWCVSLITFLGVAEASPSTQCLLNTYDNQKVYKNVAWLTTHNAFVNFKDGWTYAQQNMDIDGQFEYGVRSFMIDIHKYTPPSGAPYLALCHNACDKVSYPTGITSLSPPTSVSIFFVKIESLLANNPQDIITLHFESYTGANGWQELQPLLQQSGLDNYIGTLNPNGPNLTLGHMRQSGKRLVIFSDNRQDDHVALPYRIFHTTNYRETQYSLLDYNQCERRSDNRDMTNTTSLLVMNHFHTASYKGVTKDYNMVNDYNDIIRRVRLCHAQEGIYPNFIAVDFVEKGDWGGAKEAVMAINTASVPGVAPAAVQYDKDMTYKYTASASMTLGVLMCSFPKKFRSPIVAGASLATGVTYWTSFSFGNYIPKELEFSLFLTSQILTNGLLWHLRLCGNIRPLTQQETIEQFIAMNPVIQEAIDANGGNVFHPNAF